MLRPPPEAPLVESSRLCFVCFVVALGLCGCPGSAPPRGPEQDCVEACASRDRQCGELQCARGCNLVIDRLVERQGEQVIACIAASRGVCDDRTWARCATLIGPYADGGPPPPAVAADPDPE
jgi:hypothetical protein